MDYDELLAALAKRTGLAPEGVQQTLEGLVEILGGLDIGQKIETPLGIFEMKLRQPKRMQDVNTRKWTRSHRRQIVTLKSAMRKSLP